MGADSEDRSPRRSQRVFPVACHMSQTSHWFRFPADLFFRREDERIYALVRIAFAAVALLNLLFLWPDRQAFFSDGGLVDPEVAMSEASPVYLSVFQFARSDTAVTGVMILTALALVMLLAGIGARLAALWVLIWHVSYIARSPLPLTGWDTILRCFSFLVLVSPMGKYWTFSTLKRGFSGMVPVDVSRHGLVLMRLQVFVIYWQAVLARLLHPEHYWVNGEFLTYFMLSHHARWPGRWILESGSLMAVGTYGILFAEIAIPVLLWVRKTRWWGFLLGTALHGGVAFFAHDLGLFCLAMMMTYLSFLRKEDVERLERFVQRRWEGVEEGKASPSPPSS